MMDISTVVRIVYLLCMGSGASSSKKGNKKPSRFVADERSEKEKFIEKYHFDIATDVATPDIYMIMGDMMKADEILKVEGKYRTRKFSKWQLYLNALNSGPSDLDAEIYVKLAFSLPLSKEFVKLKDKRKLTRIQMHLLALDLDATLPEPYVEIVKDDLLPIGRNFRLLNGTEYTLRDLMTLVVSLDSKIGCAYYYLGITLSDDKKRLRVRLHGQEKESVFSRRDFFITCLELDPRHPEANAAMASILREDEKEIVVQNRVITKRELCVIGLTGKLPLCSTYCDLASTMQNDENVHLKDGTELSKLDVLLHATSADPKSVRAHRMLAYTMRAVGMNATSVNGKTTTVMDLGLYLVKLDPKLAAAYDLLASLLHGPEDCVEMRRDDHTTLILSKRALYELAIEADSKYARAYYNLATLLSQLSHKVTLKDGRTMSQLELYLHVIDLDETFAPAYNNIAIQLASPAEMVPLNNGKILSQKQLYIMAIAMDQSFAAAYHNLAMVLTSPTEEVQLNDGRRMTMEQLLRYR